MQIQRKEINKNMKKLEIFILKYEEIATTEEIEKLGRYYKNATPCERFETLKSWGEEMEKRAREIFANEFDEVLDELYEDVEILGIKYSYSHVAKRVDLVNYEITKEAYICRRLQQLNGEL